MKKLFVVFFLVSIMAVSLCGCSTNENVNSVEQSGIQQFRYSVDGDSVLIERYKGRSNVLVIEPTYEIEGKEYRTDLSDFSVGIGNSSVETVIFNEGIETINTSAFNSSDVKTVFFPKSLTAIDNKTLSYLHPDDGEKINIYYAGTEEEWDMVLGDYERTKVSDAQTGYDKGVALADALNEKLGFYEVDDSEYEYHFSSSPSELLPEALK